MVVCTKCKEDKPESEFYKDRRHTNGLKSACKYCNNKIYGQWSATKRGREYKRKYDKERYWNNLEREKKRMKKWRDTNTARHHQNVKKWREENPDKVKEYERNRPSRAAWYRKKRREDLNFRIAGSLRSRLRAATRAQLAGRQPRKGSAIENLGCSMDEFILHLEDLFQEGMSWENYGDWHIDHVSPLSGFDLSDSEQVKKACHYTNLQPLWAEENLKKGDYK